MKFQYLLFAVVACFVSVSTQANHNASFRIEHVSSQPDEEIFRFSWIARENGMYVLEGNPTLESFWRPLKKVPNFEQNEPALVENEPVEKFVESNSDRFFFRLVKH